MFISRRRLVLAGLASLTRPAVDTSLAQPFPGSSPAVANVRYVMPSPSGNGSGDSWENAASIWQLNTMIALTGAGGTVYVRADAGPYVFKAIRVTINRGGDAGNPVTIIGVDHALAPMKAIIIGTRTAWTLPADPEAVTNVRNWSVGNDTFLLKAGADHLMFKFFDFQRVGHAFHLTAPTHRNITVTDCAAYNVKRFFEHDPRTSHVDTVIRNVTVIGFSKTAIRIRGDSHNVLLEDITLNSARQDGENFSTGVECNETAHDITMRRVTAMNCHDTHGQDPHGFWNADGFASERGNNNIVREECASSGNTDAGYDDKGTNVTNIRCTATGNKVNYKFWGPSTKNIECRAIDPHLRGGVGPQMQYFVYGGYAPNVGGADVLVKGGVISDDDVNTNVFVAEGYNSVFRIAGPSITHNPESNLQLELKGWGNVFLYGSAVESTAPVITSAVSLTAAADRNFAHLLRADKQVTWAIAGGPDAAAFRVLADRRAGTLMMSAAPGTPSREIIVRATDAAGNQADQSITVTDGTTPTVFFSDTFDRADQDLGAVADWTFIREGGRDGLPGDVAIRGGKLAISNMAYRGAAFASPDCGFADHYVQATVASVPNTYNGLLACRLADASNLIGAEFRSGRVSLYERAGGTFQELGFVTEAPVTGDVIRLEVKGPFATVKRNGAVIIGPATMAGTNAAGTRAGIVSRGLAVDAWIDDYESGPL
ncbi:MAG TPA: hypothetical protein VGJ01_22060 [Pseudolabrys sp.]